VSGKMTGGPVAPIQLDDEAFLDPQTPLLIDDQVAALWDDGKCRDHWVDKDHALGFGRRALRSATFLALCELEPLRRHDHHNDWQTSEKLGQAALDALNALFEHIAGGRRVLQESGSDSLQPVLLQMANVTRYRRQDAPLDPKETGQAASAEARILMTAAAIVENYTRFAVDQVDHVASLGLQNPGNPVLKTFVLHMAEGWLALTGSAPGKGSRLSKNPFMRFVAAAWKDAGGEISDNAESFGQEGLKAAVPIMETRLAQEQFRPFWA
jgi:hypothetical protein